MSDTTYHFNCSCCDEEVVRNHSQYDVTRNDLSFGCCNDVDFIQYSNDVDYLNIKCDNCFCLLHLESWRIKDSKEDKTNYENVSFRNCCLKRVSWAFLNERKMFGDYREKVNTCIKELADNPYNRNK